MSGILLPACSIFFSILLCVVYFAKKRLPILENKIFSVMLVISILDSILVTILQCIAYYLDVDKMGTLISVLNKIDFALLILFLNGILLYIIFITNNFKKDVYYKIIYGFLAFDVLYSVIIFSQEVNVITENGHYSVTGSAINLVYIIAGLYIFSSFLIALININKADKRFIPVLSIVLLILILMGLFSINPYLIIFSIAFTFFDYIMYFTLYNPDVKMLEMEKQLKEAAIQASLAKSEFLSSMSHELRTPLNAIVGLSEDVASFKDEVPHDVREDSEDIINASNTLLELIGSILDISKIESGKLEIVDTFYSPKEEVESLTKIMRTKVAEKPLEFIINIDPKIPEVLYGDRLRIKQIINNLLSNAIKYTASGTIWFDVGWIEVSNTLTIKVKDTGSGIKPENLDKLFGKYERLEVEKVSTVQGTGLGLAITKNLIELMGGEVKVDSIWGEGTTFTVTIPQKIGTLEELEKLKQLSTYNPVEKDFSGMRILIVDDNHLNIKVLKKAIRKFDFKIDECYNGLECLNKIKSGEHYDLILLDNLMPVMNGEETIKNLRSLPNFKTPVIALTADAMTGAHEKYVGMGFNDYIAKPFTRDSIIKKLETVLSNHDIKVDNITLNVNINNTPVNNEFFIVELDDDDKNN